MQTKSEPGSNRKSGTKFDIDMHWKMLKYLSTSTLTDGKFIREFLVGYTHVLGNQRHKEPGADIRAIVQMKQEQIE